MKRFVLFVAVFFAAVPSSAAYGATVGLDSFLGEIFYGAEIGEANDLQVNYSSGTFTIVDLGAVINAGDGCSSVSIHEVTCSGATRASFDLADLNDTGAFLDQASPQAVIDLFGGPGNDHLTLCAACKGNVSGDSGADTLQGGAGLNHLRGLRGADTIMGAGGGDRIWGGSGNDTIVGGGGRDLLRPGLGDDIVGGGSGRDIVFFVARVTGVTADLGTGVVSGGGGNDTLTSVECLNGTRYDDHFWGNRRDNCFDGLGDDDVIFGRGGADSIHGGCCAGDDRLFGGPGPDIIAGGAGDDIIGGGPGGDSDELRGNEGNDRLRANDGVRDLVAGGSGFDRARVDQNDLVRRVEKLIF
jgi:Ca2+-binding RTX toxin-like protein